VTAPNPTVVPPTIQATPTIEPRPTEEATSPIPEQTRPAYEYQWVTDLLPLVWVESNAWEIDSGTLIYAVQGPQANHNVSYGEPKDWIWWKFDPVTGENTPLDPPGTDTNLAVRQALGVCADWPPEETSTDGCAGAPTLYESPYDDRVIYSPAGMAERTWMAHKDGSKIIELENIIGRPQSVTWSPDRRWAVLSVYGYRAPGMEIHYLVDIDKGTVQDLGLLTGDLLTFVSFLRPQFSPDSRHLVYGATRNKNYKIEEDYGLFILDLDTLQSEPLSDRFGPFQWDADSQGIYVLDNAIVYEFAENQSEPRKAILYHLDFSGGVARELLLAENIDFYPRDTASLWQWSYSPELQAISMVGLQPEDELGILFLAP
jgi:hypothetical protein